MKAGLEDVIAGESGICYIDGEKGVLAYRGYNIHELANNSTFEETCHLLWFGRLPKPAELDDTTKKLASNRAVPQQVIDFMKTMTCCGTARLDASFFVVSSSSAGFGSRPNHKRWQVSSKVELFASSWML